MSENHRFSLHLKGTDQRRSEQCNHEGYLLSNIPHQQTSKNTIVQIQLPNFRIPALHRLHIHILLGISLPTTRSFDLGLVGKEGLFIEMNL